VLSKPPSCKSSYLKSLWHTLARLLQLLLLRVLATRTSTTKQAITQGKVAVSKWWENYFIPTCRGKWTDEEYQCEVNHRETINHNIKRDTKIFSWGSRVCRHASPRYVDQHYVVQWLIGNPHSSSPRAPQEPTASEVTQWHAQYIRTTLWLFAREGAKPLTSHWSRPRTTSNSCRTSSAAPSRLGGGNHQEKQESRSKRTSKCQLDANSQANALEITQSYFD
jgi:hypothetical protein